MPTETAHTGSGPPQSDHGTARPGGLGSGRVRWMIVAMLCAMSFVLSVDRFNIMVAVPHIKTEFAFSEQQRGDLLAAFMFGYALALVPGGWLADRFGPWRVFTAAGIAWAALTVWTGLIGLSAIDAPVGPLRSFLITRFLLGVCEACAFPTFARAAANWVRRSERAIATGLVQAAFGVGGVVTPVMIVLIINSFGWREAFLASGLLTLVVAVAWWLFGRDHPEEHRWVSHEELQFIAQDREETRPQPLTLRWFALLVRCRSAYMLCLSQFLFGVSGFVFFSWFYSYFTEVRHVGETYAAWLQAMPFALMAVGSSLGGWAIDTTTRRWGPPWGRRTVPLASITLGGLCGVVAPTIANDTLSALVFAMAAGLLYTAAAGFWSTVIDLTRQGTGLLGGIQNGANWLGAAVATRYYPALVAGGMSWERALQLAGAAGVLSGIVWLLIDSRQQIDQADWPPS